MSWDSKPKFFSSPKPQTANKTAVSSPLAINDIARLLPLVGNKAAASPLAAHIRQKPSPREHSIIQSMSSTSSNGSSSSSHSSPGHSSRHLSDSRISNSSRSSSHSASDANPLERRQHRSHHQHRQGPPAAPSALANQPHIAGIRGYSPPEMPERPRSHRDLVDVPMNEKKNSPEMPTRRADGSPRLRPSAFHRPATPPTGMVAPPPQYESPKHDFLVPVASEAPSSVVLPSPPAARTGVAPPGGANGLVYNSSSMPGVFTPTPVPVFGVNAPVPVPVSVVRLPPPIPAKSPNLNRPAVVTGLLTPGAMPTRPNARPGPLVLVETPSAPTIAIENVVLDKTEQAGWWLPFGKMTLFAMPILCFGAGLLISYLLGNTTQNLLVAAAIAGGIAAGICIFGFLLTFHLFRSYGVWTNRRVLMVLLGSFLMIAGAGALAYGFRSWYNVHSAKILSGASYYTMTSQVADGYVPDANQVTIDYNHVYIQHKSGSTETLYAAPLQPNPALSKPLYNVWLISKFPTPVASVTDAFSGFSGSGVTTVTASSCAECGVAVTNALSDLTTTGVLSSSMTSASTRMVLASPYSSQFDPAQTVGFAAIIGCSAVTGVWILALLMGVGVSRKD